MSEQAPKTEEKKLPSSEAVMDTHAAHFDEHPEDIRPEYMNNLYLWLPGSGYLEQIRKYLKNPQKLAFIEDVAQVIEENPELRQSLEDFKAEDEAIQTEMKQIGEQMKQEEDAISQLPDEERTARWRAMEPLRKRYHELVVLKERPQRLNERLIPLYIALHKKGYTHNQIVS